ncbi:MAG TPA: hypothetical protein ENN21_10010 [Spirochaetes bacterium]|nr:hypothetical protein [Spirochaetota bacterium]
MKNLKIAFFLMLITAVLNAAVGAVFYWQAGVPAFKGYITGTLLSFFLSVLWVLGARKGMKSNTMVLLGITLGGFPLRLALLGVFAFGGLYLFQMNTTYFAVAFLIGTIVSLIIEIWAFNSMSVTPRKKLQ